MAHFLTLQTSRGPVNFHTVGEPIIGRPKCEAKSCRKIARVYNTFEWKDGYTSSIATCCHAHYELVAYSLADADNGANPSYETEPCDCPEEK